MNSQNNRIKSGHLLLNNKQQTVSKQKTSTLRIEQKKNMLMKKCQIKFNSFANPRKKKASIL